MRGKGSIAIAGRIRGQRVNLLSFLIGGAFVLLMYSSVAATIIAGSVTGGRAFDLGAQFSKLSAPLGNPFGSVNSVGNNTFQNQNLLGYDEKQDIDPIDFLNLGLGISLPINIQSLASHYIFYDPVPQTTLLGSIEFANTIVAVITARTALISSEALGDPSVTYLYPGFVGLEFRDRVTFQGNTAFLDWRAGTPGDYIRVITAELQTSTPEPNTFILLSLGIVGLGLCRKRRKQRES